MSAEEIEKLVRDEVILYRHSDSGPLLVKESEPGSAVKRLKILGVPGGSVGVTFDYKPNAALKKVLGRAFCQFSPLIDGSHVFANKKCDFAIFCERDAHWDVLLGELKSRSPNKADCKAQLDNSEIFLSFLEKLACQYHGVSKTFKVKKVVVHAATVNIKAPTNQKNRQYGSLVNGVWYLPVVPGGRNNEEAEILFSDLTPATS